MKVTSEHSICHLTGALYFKASGSIFQNDSCAFTR